MLRWNVQAISRNVCLYLERASERAASASASATEFLHHCTYGLMDFRRVLRWGLYLPVTIHKLHINYIPDL